MAGVTRIVLGGFGNVGQQIAARVSAGQADTLDIVAIAARNKARAAENAAKFGLDVPVIDAADAPHYDAILVECATYDGFRDVVEPTLRAGGHVIAVSVGALAVNLDLIDIAGDAGATLQIAGGTLPGLDIIRAASEDEITSVVLTSHINPASFEHESFIHDNGIDLAPAADGPVPIFEGSAREAAGHFPRHFNVAVTLGLVGIGLDRTQVRIRADGTLPGARHTLSVEASSVSLEMTSQNYPSPQNNRTSMVVALSILAALRRESATLRIGS
ncbi:aspartate dehydrogenase domain-containing protein [Chachezhania antarctica]|uniref:aspartate dehydrogenase domain-containing protein n=1 Tax=Chachezhania antarctica TaxID=2340860 RepID=UPI0013CE9A5A|nr:aspartate dehydrogenase domain-containing protein [Chachezhania antarctica]|tara:strand:- start:12598 stop:13416 length:819 start_codon:yes stop_codon:yes gene_type:complete